MDPDVAEHVNRSIQEYAQRISEMGGSRGYQGTQYGRGQTSSNTTRSTFAENRARISQSWNEKVLSYLDQELLMCEMVDPSTSRFARVISAAAIKTKNYRENRKRDYEGQIEEPYPCEKLQRTRGPIKRN